MKKTEDIRLGKRIKDIRSKLDMDQRTFSEKLGVTVSALSNWENGRNQPKYPSLIKIANLANIEVNELLHGTYEEYIRKIIYEAIAYSQKSDEEDELTETQKKNMYIAQTYDHLLSEIDFYTYHEEDELMSALQKKETEVVRLVANECINMGIEPGDKKAVLDCIVTVFSKITVEEEYTNEGFINFVKNKLSHVIDYDYWEYLYYPKTAQSRETVDRELYDKIEEIIVEAIEKISSLKKSFVDDED